MSNGIFLDSNILIYSLDPEAGEKRAKAADLLRKLVGSRRLVLAPQTLNECYRVLTDRRGIMPRSDARRFVSALLPSCTAPGDVSNLSKAWEIQDQNGFGWRDCLMLASAESAGCSVFVTEDLEHDRVVGALRIVNLFREDQSVEALAS